MSDVVLPVEIRERTGSGGARAARRDGFVPGVIYGGKRGPVAIALPGNMVRNSLGKGQLLSQVIDIEHKGERQQVLVRDIQFDPVSDAPLHIDLFRVDDDQIISVEVSVRFTNEADSPGLKRGGVLNVVRHQVELDCPAAKIPDELVVDLSGVAIGDSIHISAIALPDGVTPTIKDRDFTIATVVGSRASVEADEADGAGEEGEAPAEE